ncbi:MAG: hypothetical protein ABWY27_13585 [Telluria sp.]
MEVPVDAETPSGNGRNIWRTVGRWLKNLLAVVGFFTVLVGTSRFLLNHFRDEPSQGGEIRSPNGRYKAVLLNESGGGGIAPYCIDTVVVLPVKAKVDFRDDSQVVYVGGRNVFSNDHRNGPAITWSESNRLEIRFQQDSVGGVAAMRLKRHAVMGAITVNYQIEP